jgi:DNA (cytosine-5)-methyltransferase 1
MNLFPNLETIMGRAIFPTPTSQDAKNCTLPPSQRNRDSIPGMMLRDGAAPGGQLNPTWVEWLMGWPLGWTDLKPLETDKFPQWRHSHGGF